MVVRGSSAPFNYVRSSVPASVFVLLVVCGPRVYLGVFVFVFLFQTYVESAALRVVSWLVEVGWIRILLVTSSLAHVGTNAEQPVVGKACSVVFGGIGRLFRGYHGSSESGCSEQSCGDGGPEGELLRKR